MHTAASVLTVEDNPITRTELRLVLEDAGFDVVADARDGAEAVELAREHRPDLILLDLGLPVLDGIEAARADPGGEECPDRRRHRSLDESSSSERSAREPPRTC